MNAVIGKPNARRSSAGNAASVRSSASPVVTPSASRTASIGSSARRPVKASEPIMPGEKREPSSFSHTAISTGFAGAHPEVRIASTASNPATTPKAPSNFPPVG